MRKSYPVFAICTVLMLSACGKQGDLEPVKGQSLPPAAVGQAERPTANELLTPSTQARPERSDELLRRSEKRQDDKFDLPPPE